MKSPLLVAVLGSQFLSGCLSGEEVESSGSAIVGGEVEPGYEAVGELVTDAGGCTATLVAPNVIVSAKHCIAANTAPSAVTFRTGINGETLSGLGEQLFYVGGFDLAGDGTLPQDFLAVRLDRNVDGIAPMSFRRAAMGAGEVGRGVLHVGYGFTSESGLDYGTRRSGGGTLTEVRDDTFLTARNGQATVCFGDSGGPVFLDGELAGIANGTFLPACTDQAIHARIDQYAGLVDQAIGGGDGGGGGDGDGGGGGDGDVGGGGGDVGGGDGDVGGGDGDVGGGDGDVGGGDGDVGGGDGDVGGDPGDGAGSCPGGGGVDAGIYYDQNPGCDADGDLIIGLTDRDLGLGDGCDPDSVNLCMESNQSCLDGVEDGDYGCAPWKRLCSLRGEGANGELCQ